MSSPAPEPNMARRPSLAESIEVTVEEHTAHTVLPAEPGPFNLASYQFPSTSASVQPAPNRLGLAPPVTVEALPVELPFMGRRRSLAESIEVTIEQTTTSSYSPAESTGLVAVDPPSHHAADSTDAPPAYRFPALSSPTLLSFYPSGGITKPKSRASSPVLPSSARLAPPPPPPPSYTCLPRTSAERYFYLGLLCPPLWLAGAYRLWRSAIPSHLPPDDHRAKDDVEAGAQAADIDERSWWAAVGLGPEDGAGGWQEFAPRVEETVALWRKEELVWARRCAKCLGGAVVMGAMVATVVSTVFR